MKALRYLLLLVCLLGCKEENPVKIDPQDLYGTWAEVYHDPFFSMDSMVHWTFNEDGTYTSEVQDMDGGHFTYSGTFSLAGNIITIDPSHSDVNSSYTIVKIDYYGMDWQRVGTAYKEGNYVSDYKHFEQVK